MIARLRNLGGRLPAGGAAAPLFYWLVVISGLAGLTALRFDALGEVGAIWLGSVAGVGAGQLVSFLRLRARVVGIVTVAAMFFSPLLLMVLYPLFGGHLSTLALAFIPAAICGYLSLTERGGLAAFWYPAMLWMVVILDRPSAGALDLKNGLPLVIGLGALFVAYLRASETRRTAIWQAHAGARLAEALPRKVLRTSPLRTASQHALTALAGGAALVLAVWVAPHLWREQAGKTLNPAANAGDPLWTSSAAGGLPCCPLAPQPEEERRVRVSEYLPLINSRENGAQPAPPAACQACRNGKPLARSEGPVDVYADGFGGTSGRRFEASAPPANGGASLPAVAPTHALPTYPTLPAVPAVPAAAASPPKPAESPAAAATAAPIAEPKHAVIVAVTPPAAPVDAGTPWRSALAIGLAGVAVHALFRAVRRQLTLRHLASPFWPETLDQRISNHWQRMLIGLRDAGIHAGPDEQPQALARRVGLEGMVTCATILERVRHGVRVDSSDLEAMGAASAAAYRAARRKAGASGRAAALVRSPLA